MSRICVPGLLALLAVAPLTVRADDPPSQAKKEEAKAPAAAAKPVAEAPAANPAEKAAEPAAKKEDAPPAKAAEPARAAAPAAVAPAAKKAIALKLAPLLRLNLARPQAIRIGAGPGVAAEDDEGEDGDNAAAKLSEEDKKALDEFVQKAAKLKRKQFEDTMKATVEAVAKEQKLERDTEQKLLTLSAKAVDATLPEWEQAFRKWLETLLPRAAGPNPISKWAPENYIRNASVSDFTPPDETAAWKAALKEVLTPEQLASREEAAKAAEKKFQEDFGDYLATCEGQAGDQMAAAIDSELIRIVQFSGLDEERHKKLKAASDEAVKQCVKDWRAQTEKQLRAMAPKEREQMTSRGGMFGVNLQEKKFQPKERTVWKDAVAQHLQEQERQTLEARYKEVRGRRADALAILLTNDLDRLVGFSAAQREQFLPLAAKRLTKLPDYYFSNPENNGWYSLDPGQMLQQVQKLKDEELKPLLSETQLKRFRDASPDQMSRGNSYTREKLDMGDLPKPEEMDEVEVERLLSRFLHRESKKMKLKMFSSMEALVEHISRVTVPSPETVGVLTTAAKGAAEEMAQNGINNLASWLRNQFQSVKPSDVPGRLENLYNPYFGNDRNQMVPPALWNTTVQRLLNEEQRKQWKAEMDAREQWRREGLASIVVTEVEKRLVLPEEQRTKLRKKVDSVIQEYEQDFSNYFSFGWHLQGYYTLIPIAMFSDKEMEEHFDKKQIDTLKEKSLANALQYAEMIRQNHNSRLRR